MFPSITNNLSGMGHLEKSSSKVSIRNLDILSAYKDCNDKKNVAATNKSSDKILKKLKLPPKDKYQERASLVNRIQNVEKLIVQNNRDFSTRKSLDAKNCPTNFYRVSEKEQSCHLVNKFFFEDKSEKVLKNVSNVLK